MPNSDIQNTVSDKQLAANRANAAHSTGPRTPEGKARSAQNARQHGFTASIFAVARLEDLQTVAHLKADLVAAYQPVNSQELLALERLAIAQQRLFHAAALESGLFSTCLNLTIGDENHPAALLHPDLPKDLEVTRLQNRNICLAEGFQRMTDKKSTTWQLFLRYQAQAERHYRRAVEELERLKALRPNLPNEPIFDPHPEENESLADPETNPFPDSGGPPGAASGSNPIGSLPQDAPASPAPVPSPAPSRPPNPAPQSATRVNSVGAIGLAVRISAEGLGETHFEDASGAAEVEGRSGGAAPGAAGSGRRFPMMFITPQLSQDSVQVVGGANRGFSQESRGPVNSRRMGLDTSGFNATSCSRKCPAIPSRRARPSATWSTS